jgi:hypothetical protein
MPFSNLIRVGGGLAALVGGALSVVGGGLAMTIAVLVAINPPERLRDEVSAAIVDAVGVEAVGVAAAASMNLLTSMLVLGALIGLYVVQSQEAGRLGVVGFLAALLGQALLVSLNWSRAFVFPPLHVIAPEGLESELSSQAWLSFGSNLSWVLFLLGWLLFGVATLRARVYPRAAAVVLMIGVGLYFLSLVGMPVIVGGIVLNLAIAWLGFTLLTGRGFRPEQYQRVDRVP